MTARAEARFWSKVNKSGECWEWTKGKDKCDYGVFWFNGKDIGAHRFAWMTANGDIPTGLEILHSCDNPSCCRPSHLSAGTHRNNMADMHARNRSNQKGERNGNATLTDISAAAIKGDCRSNGVIANEYGVSTATVSLIQAGQTWKHLN